ncbi:tetratricopeptide repeat protein [Anaerobaca lacustris]|uniref:Tetratricopeptide repeat protein n=1 Tax=Anaerobaca lacustris TaxID=3044600 RepID=A0AAW6TWR3_9BACT|nr:tetratricopeptide repeat protein [Sedimentisphaerales bacterium M17dextr]
MRGPNRSGKVNVKVLVILLLVVVALGVSLVVARQVRRKVLSKMDLEAGTAAFEQGDETAAYKHFQEYLGRNPDDIEVLKKYAQSRLLVRPLESPHVLQAIGAYRRVIQLDAADEEAYEKLAMIYASIGNASELAYIAGRRLEHAPDDANASLRLAEAMDRMDDAKGAREVLVSLVERLENDAQRTEQYVQACLQISAIEEAEEVEANALTWVNKALDRSNTSAPALAARARLYRLRASASEADAVAHRAQAHRDLLAAEEQGTDDPKVRLSLASEWMMLGEFDRADAGLAAAGGMPEAVIREHFLYADDWVLARALVGVELAIRKGTIEEGLAEVDKALAALERPGHRFRILPLAIRLYVASGGEQGASQAAAGLVEYEELLYARTDTASFRVELAYLRALVARARGEMYDVINALQPVVGAGSSDPEPWRLLAEAYGRTDQPRRATDAIRRYLQVRPGDTAMLATLANEYFRMQDWARAAEVARIVEERNPDNIDMKLLRMEANVQMATAQGESPDMSRLLEIEKESSELRRSGQNAKRADLRVLAAMIGVHLAQAESDPETKARKLAEVEAGLKQAVEQSDQPLRAEMQLVRFYSQTRQREQAVARARAICSQRPVLAEPWMLLAGLEADSGDTAAALRTLAEAGEAVASDRGKRSIALRRALLELTRGDRATGIRLLGEMAAADPGEIRARALLLDTREVRQDPARTEQLISELEQAEGPGGLMWRFCRASTWLAGDQWRSQQQGIVDLLQYCIDADPRWEGPPLLLSQLYEKLGDVKRAEDVCRQALTRNPSATAIADRLMLLLERQNRVADAEAVRQQIEADPRVASGWNIRSALRTGDYSQAIDELRLRISNDDRDAESRILLARLLYWQTRDTDQALAYLDEAEQIAPRSLVGTSVRAAILRAEGQHDQAQRLLNEYVADRDDFTAYLMRANYYVAQEQWDQAEADYKTLTTLEGEASNRATGYVLLSDFYSRRDRVAEAVQTLEESLAAYPGNLSLRRMLMHTLFRREQDQDKDRALAMLAALEKEYPDDLDLINVRIRELLRDGDPESIQTAMGKLEELVKLQPTAVKAYVTLIDLSIRSGQYEAARNYAIRAAGANLRDPALLSARSRAEMALGNTQMAIEVARLALREDPNHVPALDMLVEIGLTERNEALLLEAVGGVRSIPDRDPNRGEALNLLAARALNSRHPTLLRETESLIESELGRAPSNTWQLLLTQAQILAAQGTPAKGIPEVLAYCQSEEGRTNVDAIVVLSDLYRMSGDLDEAHAWIERAEQIDPRRQTVVHARFLWRMVQKQYDELTGISSAYIDCSDQNPNLVLRAAAVLGAADSAVLKKEGLALFEHAVALWPTLLDARLGLASALYQVGEMARAKQAYQELLEQYPNNTQVLNDLAWILQEHDGDYNTALQLANRGLNLERDDARRRHLLDTRGTILSKMRGRFPDAKADFEELLKLTAPDTPQRAKALLNLARICARLGDLAETKRHVDAAMEIDRAKTVFTPEERAEAKGLLEGR